MTVLPGTTSGHADFKGCTQIPVHTFIIMYSVAVKCMTSTMTEH